MRGWYLIQNKRGHWLENCFSDIHMFTLTHVKYVKAHNDS